MSKFEIFICRFIFFASLIVGVATLASGCNLIKSASKTAERVQTFIDENKEETRALLAKLGDIASDIQNVSGSVSNITGNIERDYDATVSRVKDWVGNAQGLIEKFGGNFENFEDEMRKKLPELEAAANSGLSTEVGAGGGLSLILAWLMRNFMSAREKKQKFEEQASTNASNSATLAKLETAIANISTKEGEVVVPGAEKKS